MKIELSGLGKRFNYDWVFRHLSLEFCSGDSYAILGPNGSGKSTLLQIIAGSLSHSTGHISYTCNGLPVDAEQVYQYCAISAPNLELVEEFTLAEFLGFHQSFKKYMPGLDPVQIMEIIGLQQAAHKQLSHFSSGMKQRVKLAQAIFSDTPVLLLDEPCTNLDEKGIDLYHTLIGKFCRHRLLIISSNEEQEYRSCSHRLQLSDYKI